MTCLVDEGKAVDIVYLDFCKAFVTVSYNILVGPDFPWMKTGAHTFTSFIVLLSRPSPAELQAGAEWLKSCLGIKDLGELLESG